MDRVATSWFADANGGMNTMSGEKCLKENDHTANSCSCHEDLEEIKMPDQQFSRIGPLIDHIKHELVQRFRIGHPALEFETGDSGRSDLLCNQACSNDNGHVSGEKDSAEPNDENHDEKMASRFQAILFHSLRLLLGFVFLFACYDKMLHPQAFARAVYNYQILPDASVNLAALTLPWLELLLGVCLVAGFWLPGATVLSTGLLTVFISAMVFNQIRGLDIYCGCFSAETADGIAGFWIVVRDASFLAISVYLMLKVHFARPVNRISYSFINL
jgi:uncharacterized membrane protein YphA (DoxX/SURF4 family)